MPGLAVICDRKLAEGPLYLKSDIPMQPSSIYRHSEASGEDEREAGDNLECEGMPEVNRMMIRLWALGRCKVHLFKGALLQADQLLLLSLGHLEVRRLLKPEMQLHSAGMSAM